MRKLLTITTLLLLTIICSAAGPHKVEVARTAQGRWTFVVDGKEFFAHGATVYPIEPQSQTFYQDIGRFGANMIRNHRTYTTSGEYLDKAASLGLMVHAGLEFKSIRSGYYAQDEPSAIAAQEKRILEVVEKFKDHPAILCWCIANEFEINHATEPLTAQYESIERIAQRIHQIDPNHPVTIAVVDGFPPQKVNALKNICKSIDFLSCNGYIKAGDRYDITRDLTTIGWDKAVFCTELGPEGWWLHEKLPERRFTDWGCVVDYTSTEKEARYDRCIKVWMDDPRCIGIATFLWGNQTGSRDEILEWYGLVDKNGYTFGAADIMQKYWTGSYPAAPAPRIETRSDLTMNGKTASDWIHIQPGTKNSSQVRAKNPAGTKLRYDWRIVAERSHDAANRVPDGIPGLITRNGRQKARFIAPQKPGAYRLYIYIYDDTNRKAAYASIPFLVEGDTEALGDLGGRP